MGMLPERGAGDVLPGNPVRAEGDPSTNKGQDTSRSLVLSPRVPSLLQGEWELSTSTRVRLQTGLPSRSPRGCPSLTLTEMPHPRTSAALQGFTCVHSHFGELETLRCHPNKQAVKTAEEQI